MLMADILVTNPVPTAAQRRRFQRIRAAGYRYVGGVGTIRYAEASFVASRMGLGLVLDRGETKDHGLQTQRSYPAGYAGDPVYWVRRVYQVGSC